MLMLIAGSRGSEGFPLLDLGTAKRGYEAFRGTPIGSLDHPWFLQEGGLLLIMFARVAAKDSFNEGSMAFATIGTPSQRSRGHHFEANVIHHLVCNLPRCRENRCQQ